MIKYYYIDDNKSKVGPVLFEDLIKKDLTVHTPVCVEGCDKWVPAQDVPELKFLFESNSKIGQFHRTDTRRTPWSHNSFSRISSSHFEDRSFDESEGQEDDYYSQLEEETRRWREATHMNRTEDYDRIDDEDENTMRSYENNGSASFWGVLVFIAICLLCGILFFIID